VHSVCLLLPVHWDRHIWHSIPKELQRELKLCARKKQVSWTEYIVEYLTCNLVYVIWKTTAWQWKLTCLPAHWFIRVMLFYLLLSYLYYSRRRYFSVASTLLGYCITFFHIQLICFVSSLVLQKIIPRCTWGRPLFVTVCTIVFTQQWRQDFFCVVKLGIVLNLLAILQKSYTVVNVILQCGR